jgi:hypothetical protein
MASCWSRQQQPLVLQSGCLLLLGWMPGRHHRHRHCPTRRRLLLAPPPLVVVVEAAVELQLSPFLIPLLLLTLLLPLPLTVQLQHPSAGVNRSGS